MWVFRNAVVNVVVPRSLKTLQLPKVKRRSPLARAGASVFKTIPSPKSSANFLSPPFICVVEETLSTAGARAASAIKWNQKRFFCLSFRCHFGREQSIICTSEIWLLIKFPSSVGFPAAEARGDRVCWKQPFRVRARRRSFFWAELMFLSKDTRPIIQCQRRHHDVT